MAGNRVVKVRSSVTTHRQTQYGSVEKELMPPDVSRDEKLMPKTGTSQKDRKVRMDRDVQVALNAISTLNAPPKKKGKRTFPTNALQKRMQSGDI